MTASVGRVGDEGEDVADTPVTFDRIAEDLQALRASAGLPSYHEIVVRIGRERQARGVAPEAARPARTTVYDAFRTGRRRLDPVLVGEIVRALGEDEETAAAWERRVRSARRETVAPAAPAPGVAAPGVTAPGITAPTEQPIRALRALSRRAVVAVLVGCLALNLAGRVLVDSLGLSVYLDMVGTAISAIVLGPWWGALVGLTTNLAGVPLSGTTSIPFALVNVAGALVWGYGVRRTTLGRTLPRFFLLNVLVALVCTAVAAPIIVIGFHGMVGHGADAVVATLRATTHHLVVSVVAGNVLTSVADKLISGFAALAAAEALGRPLLRPGEPAA